MANSTVPESFNSNLETEPQINQRLLSLPRTKALQKSSLFGTTLEKVDYDSLKNIEGKYITEGNVKVSSEKYTLPNHLKDKISGNYQIDFFRKELQNQKQAVADADKNLNSKKENALSFKELNDNDSSSTTYNPSWAIQRDLEHCKEINSLGLNETESYNRDKYGSKPFSHQYSLIGDPLATSMQFNNAVKENQMPPNPVVWNKGRHLPFELMKSTKPTEASGSHVTLPLNIRHKFGSRDCDILLSDENLVRRTLEKQSIQRSKLLKPFKEENGEKITVDLSGTYESLGHMTRYNVFPGLSTDNKVSSTKQDYNDLVYLHRIPNPDQYRYQRDDLSTWSEHNVLRERMKKAWNDNHPLGGQKK